MKAWVFDLDGTLVDSASFYILALADVFREHGVPFADAEFRLGLTTPVDVLLPRFFGAEAGAAACAGLQARFNRDAAKIKMFAGVEELLCELKNQGVQLAIWTARERESAEIILQATGLGRLADTFVSSNCVSVSKPSDEGLRLILKRLGRAANETVMIGDHEHDMIAANTAGTRALRAAWSPHFGIHSTGVCARADQQFASVEELRSWARRPVTA